MFTDFLMMMTVRFQQSIIVLADDNNYTIKRGGPKSFYSRATSVLKKDLRNKNKIHLTQNILEIQQIPVKREISEEAPEVQAMREKKVKEFERYRV